MKKAFRKGMAVLTVTAVLSTGVAGCGMGGMRGGMNGAGMGQMGVYGQMGQANASVLTVDIQHPVRSNIYLLTELIGTVQPEQTTDIYPSGSGTVTAVHFKVGDTVEKGQPLITIDSDSVNSASISLENAQMQLENAQKELERNKVLYENDGITRQALENSENQVKSAELSLRSAQNNYNNAAKNTTVTANMSGVVESKNIDVYDNASPQKSICTITKTGSMEVVFEVSERVRDVLTLGQTMTVTKSGKTCNGTIKEVASKTTDNTGLFQVKASLSEGANFANGSKVTLELVTDKAEDVVIIPLNAIYYDNGKPYVFISNDGVAELVYIETGIYDDKNIEVKKGLTEDMEVITSWSSKLTNGTMVQSVDAVRAQQEAAMNASAQGGQRPEGASAQGGQKPEGVPAQGGQRPEGVPAQGGQRPEGVPAQDGQQSGSAAPQQAEESGAGK